MKKGRPSIMTPKIIDKLREAFMMGCSDREACIYANIANQTLYNYQQEHPEFLEQKITYKTNPLLKARKTIFNNLGEVKTAQWYMERKEGQETLLDVKTESNLCSTEQKRSDEKLIKDLTEMLECLKKEGKYKKISCGQRIGMGGVVLESPDKLI